MVMMLTDTCVHARMRMFLCFCHFEADPLILVQPDWDMFHSQHPAAELHALARAVSGGPVYVSDYPGKHNFDILRCGP